MEAFSRDRLYTYEDYLAFPDDIRCELIDGVVYDMAPAPTPSHQSLSSELVRHLGNFLKGGQCRVYAAPIDVRLTGVKGKDTVVQPDISVVCERGRVTDKGVTGAPTLVVEILSPSTTVRDMITKRALYERNGVPEYWIVSPPDRTIVLFVLTDGRYESTLFESGEIESIVLPGFKIDLAALFLIID